MDASSLAEGCVLISCPDPTCFRHRTNANVYANYDALAAASPAALPELQQLLGLKRDRHGLMEDPHVRTLYKPVDHTLRDWQHTLVNNGVGNTLVANLVRVMLTAGITIALINNFIMSFVLPAKYGKVKDTWVTKKRLGPNMMDIKAFSSEMLTIIPLLAVFAMSVFDEAHPLRDHAECMWTFHLIVGICRFGPTDALPYVEELRALITKHAELFVRLYPRCQRPKFHHLFHIIDNMIFLRKLLSCFVTERKHRLTKRCALYAFRGIENSVTRQLLNRTCQAFIHEPDLFRASYLINPATVRIDAWQFLRAHGAVLHCGGVRVRDVVWMNDRNVGVVRLFWAATSGDNIVVELDLYRRLDASEIRWDTSSTVGVMYPCSAIVDAIIWKSLDASTIRVCVPVRALV